MIRRAWSRSPEPSPPPLRASLSSVHNLYYPHRATTLESRPHQLAGEVALQSHALEDEPVAGAWSPLPDHVDLPAYEDWQDPEVQRTQWRDVSPGVLGQYALGAHSTTFCIHRDLLIGPLRKKSLIPKLSEKWCARPREISYQWFLRHLLYG